MPNLAAFHPQIVHFVVVLLLVGVALRIVSITGRLKFTSPAAALFLLMGAVAALIAVRSGLDAHGPVERIPGVRDLVVDHEGHGITTRNFFLVVAVIELVALAMSRAESMVRYVRFVHVASALVGLVGCLQLYEAAEHGGQIVYSYGGGPGLRTGDPRDVERLLLAGLYNQSQADRKAGRGPEAAELVATMTRRFPNDPSVRLLSAESKLVDLKQAVAALAELDSVKIDSTDGRLRARHATIKADAYLFLRDPAMARRALEPVVAAFPENARLKAKLDSIPR